MSGIRFWHGRQNKFCLGFELGIAQRQFVLLLGPHFLQWSIE